MKNTKIQQEDIQDTRTLSSLLLVSILRVVSLKQAHPGPVQ